jgi:two-component system, cell cycle response regulator DivK
MSENLILLIEDNPKNMKLLRDVLGHDGYAVVEAVTAEDGITLARERGVSLVLMDIQLPGMDGLEAVKLLKEDDLTASVPVVAVTAFAMKDDRQRALDAGFDEYLEKPISVQALREVVGKFIGPGGEKDG